MAKLVTRHIGPWTGPQRYKMRNRQKLDVVSWQTRVREYSIGGRAYLEIWPRGYHRGDKRVARTPVPKPAALPPLTFRQSPNRYTRTGRTITGIVIHKIEGSYAGGVSWMTNPRSKVSAHFAINSDGSHITQMVRYRDVAWHIRGYNDSTIGIEMSGTSNTPADVRQVRATARLVAYLCHRFDIPPVQGTSSARGGIVGHKQVAGHKTNSDPGGFSWSAFLAMVREEYRVGFADSFTYGRY